MNPSILPALDYISLALVLAVLALVIRGLWGWVSGAIDELSGEQKKNTNL